jgi:hypothetical protein
MAMLISIPKARAAAPPRMRTRRISSVAYADELIASELKMASAFVLLSRSPSSASLASGRPKKKPLTAANARPVGLVGALAASLAVSWPGPV